MSDVTPETKAQLVSALNSDAAHAELDVVTELAAAARTVGLSLAPVMVEEKQLLDEIGRLLAKLRGLILLPDGLPDWNGRSLVYRLVESLVVDACFDPSIDSRPAVMNRIRKRTVRAVPEAMLNTVLGGLDFTLTDAEKDLVLKGTRIENDDQIVNELNRHFAARMTSTPV